MPRHFSHYKEWLILAKNEVPIVTWQWLSFVLINSVRRKFLYDQVWEREQEKMRAGKKHVWWKIFNGQASPADLKLCLLSVVIFLENLDAYKVKGSTSRKDSAANVEQLVLWSHKTCLMGNLFPCCPVAPQFLWHIPMTHKKKRQVQEISFDQGTDQWTTIGRCTEEIVIPLKQRLPGKFLAHFLVFDTFPFNSFKHFLTCYQNKEIPFFWGLSATVT